MINEAVIIVMLGAFLTSALGSDILDDRGRVNGNEALGFFLFNYKIVKALGYFTGNRYRKEHR